MMTIIIIIALGCSIGPVLLSEIMLFIVDLIRKSSFNDPKKRKAKGIKSTDMFEPKRPEFTRKLSEALKDDRLLSKKSEKRNKWGIAIDPGPAAMTYRKLYAIVCIAGIVIGSIGAVLGQPVVIGIGVVVGMMWCPIAVKQGKAKMDAEKDIYDTIFVVVKQHMGIDANADPRSVIKISEWTTPEEPQLIADGRTKASEEGELEEFEKQLPQPDKKGRVKQPKIAEFRTTPLSMQVTFPATFREAGTDDTLMHLNEAFGHVTEWVAERDVPDEKHPGEKKTISGWDFPGHTAYLRTVPPLPTMAMFPVDFDKGGSWNKIKLGRTVSGEAFWDLKVTPMALVPLAVDTLVWRRIIADTASSADNKSITSETMYEAVRLDDIKEGDRLLTEMGVETNVKSLTPIHREDDTYRISFIDDKHDRKRIYTVKAAGSHLWPVDVDATAHSMQAGDFDTGESIREMTSDEIYEAVRSGVHPMLAPVCGDGRMINWRVYSISFINPEDLMCINVDDPTHTFLISTIHPDAGNVHMNHADALANSIPTHNCGSPLALDTVLTREDGSDVTMAEVKKGDVIEGSNGNMTMVKAVSHVMEPEHLYRLTLEPVDDESM